MARADLLLYVNTDTADEIDIHAKMENQNFSIFCGNAVQIKFVQEIQV